MKIKVKEVAYHRNGVAGEGFHVVSFSYREDGVAHPNMVGVVFEGRGRVAVLDANMTAAGNVTFAQGNSWRGDHFENALRYAISDHEKALRKTFDTHDDSDVAIVAIEGAIEAHDKDLDKVAQPA